MDPAHPFNNTNAAIGYYSDLNSAGSLTDGTGIQWNNADDVLVGTDSSGNTTRYVIQRMCRAANTVPAATDCLYSGQSQNTGPLNIPLPQDVCNGPGCPTAGQSPQIRITTRTSGPKTPSFMCKHLSTRRQL